MVEINGENLNSVNEDKNTDNVMLSEQGETDSDGVTQENISIDNVPEKFIKDGKIQYEQILKSYSELEKKFYSQDKDIEQQVDDNNVIPEQGYDINIDEMNISRNNDLEQQMIENGFSQAQAQKVYEMANDYMREELNQIANEKIELMEQELSLHFGGVEKWEKIKLDIANWGSANLNKTTFDELSYDVKGIKNLYAMMESSREFPITDNNQASGITQAGLYKMMDNPKYWRDGDPEYISQVEKGFKDLYGNDEIEV